MNYHISRKSKYTECSLSICSCCPGCISACRHLHPFPHSHQDTAAVPTALCPAYPSAQSKLWLPADPLHTQCHLWETSRRMWPMHWMHSLPSCRPFIWCMGDWEQTDPQKKDPVLTLTVKEEHRHYIGHGILSFPGRPGNPMKRFLLLRRGKFTAWASVSVKLFSCYNITVKLQ